MKDTWTREEILAALEKAREDTLLGMMNPDNERIDESGTFFSGMLNFVGRYLEVHSMKETIEARDAWGLDWHEARTKNRHWQAEHDALAAVHEARAKAAD